MTKLDRQFLRSNVAIVNLSREEIQINKTPDNVVKALLGGRGINMYYLNKYYKRGMDPFSPENPLIFGTGVLTGTGAPNSSRMNITTKSPESKALGDSNIGGFFPAVLRGAGIDRIVVLGKAKVPSYLFIKNGVVDIRDANNYWGMNTNATQESLRRDLGTNIETVTIGEAGEKLVRFACIRTGIKNAAGRSGTGAVMGSKNLKAVVADPSEGIPIKYPSEFIQRVTKINEYLKNSKIVQVLGRVGTPLLYEVSNYLGAIRTHNSQLNAFEETLNAERIHTHVEKMLSCFACVVHCRHRNTLDGEGPEYTSIVLLGANVGVSDTERVIELNNLANDLGLDVSSTGTMIGWAIELFERGMIDESITGRPLRFGDFELVRDLMIDISKREGFGNILAESTRAVKTFGSGSEDFLIAIKGLPQSDPHDVRYIKSFSLGIATASRGADHLRSRPTLDILDIPEELMNSIHGMSIDPDPTSYNTKEYLVYYQETIHALQDCIGICRFICRGFNSPRLLGYEHYSELLKLVTGLEYSEVDLQAVGKRVVELERRINFRMGLTGKDDTLPKRYFDDPMPLAIAKGHRIDRGEFQQMLSRYYALRGWDKDGAPTSEESLF